jgi:ribonuclease HII
MTTPSEEIDRWQYERQFYQRGHTLVAGVDEVGRGPLAGPVIACAVVLPRDFDVEGVDDSKLLSPARRLAVFPHIAAKCLAWAIGCIDVETIDRLNILRASLMAMHRAICELPLAAEAVIVDGNHKIPDLPLPQMPVVKGDQKSISVACASIMAKEVRDRLMEDYDRQYPGFGFGDHKGYATPEHLAALDKLGPVPIHRKSFRTIREQNQQNLDL